MMAIDDSFGRGETLLLAVGEFGIFYVTTRKEWPV